MGISDLTVQDWGIIYAALLSTGGIVWQASKSWRDRRRLTVNVQPEYEERISPDPAGFYERWGMVMLIKSQTPKPVKVMLWGIEKPTAGEGPYVTFNDPLPLKLEGYGEFLFHMEDDNLKVFTRTPRRIFVQDERGKKWRASRKTTRRAIELAENARNRNSKRTTEPPERVKEGLARMQQKRSVFGSVPPGSGPPKGTIFGDPKPQ